AGPSGGTGAPGREAVEHPDREGRDGEDFGLRAGDRDGRIAEADAERDVRGDAPLRVAGACAGEEGGRAVGPVLAGSDPVRGIRGTTAVPGAVGDGAAVEARERAAAGAVQAGAAVAEGGAGDREEAAGEESGGEARHGVLAGEGPGPGDRGAEGAESGGDGAEGAGGGSGAGGLEAADQVDRGGGGGGGGDRDRDRDVQREIGAAEEGGQAGADGGESARAGRAEEGADAGTRSHDSSSGDSHARSGSGPRSCAGAGAPDAERDRRSIPGGR